jgi:hypothetical protein
MIFRGIIYVNYENRTEHQNILCGKIWSSGMLIWVVYVVTIVHRSVNRNRLAYKNYSIVMYSKSILSVSNTALEPITGYMCTNAFTLNPVYGDLW